MTIRVMHGEQRPAVVIEGSCCQCILWAFKCADLVSLLYIKNLAAQQDFECFICNVGVCWPISSALWEQGSLMVCFQEVNGSTSAGKHQFHWANATQLHSQSSQQLWQCINRSVPVVRDGRTLQAPVGGFLQPWTLCNPNSVQSCQ